MLNSSVYNADNANYLLHMGIFCWVCCCYLPHCVNVILSRFHTLGYLHKLELAFLFLLVLK